MKKRWKQLLRIGIAGLVFALSYRAGTAFPSLYYYTILFICPFAVLYAWVQLLLILYDMRFARKLIRRLQPYLRPAADRFRRLVSHAANRLLRLARSSAVYRKFEYRRLRDTSRITGYSDEYRHSSAVPTGREYDSYTWKWRKCRTDAERIRYTYLKYVETNRKAGKPFSYADTPGMLHSQWHTDADDAEDVSEMLISYYYPARYGQEEGQSPVPQDALEQMHGRWH